MNWNDQQLAAIAGILAFAKKPFDQNDPTGWAITIRGHAGTGKTTMVQEAISQVLDWCPEINVAVSAPTNKATQVLRTFGKDAGIEVETCTIFSLLGLVLGSEGEVKRCFEGHEGSFDLYDIVIIDEGSMVGNMLMDKICERAMKYGVKIIFMGDHCQLNPVNEGQSRVFSSEEVPTTYSLTKIMRQDEGSPIRQVVGHTRALADKSVVPPKFDTMTTPEGDGLHCLIGGDFTEALLDQFDCEEYHNDSRFCRVLAWTNKEVDRLNRIIRNRIYGKGCPDFMTGETVAVLTPVLDENNQPVIFTDDEVEIVSVGTSKITDRADFDTFQEGHPEYLCWVLTVQLPTGGTYRITTLHKDSLADFNRRCKKLSDRAKKKIGSWKAFWAFKESFTLVRPVHAMTVHKSQGQTFNTVFVQCKDLQNNNNKKERARLLYVATSRATTNLVINLKQLR